MNKTKYAFFILSHERFKTMSTDKMLNKFGCKGMFYVVVDDKDKQIDLYKNKFGDRLLVYNKDEYEKITDTVDNNIDEKRTGLFARNFIIDKAKELGYKYIIMLDDDYINFKLRYIKENKLLSKNISDLKYLFDCMTDYMDKCENIDILSCCGQGDYMGGVASTPMVDGIVRKAVNTFIIRTNTNIRFSGRINDDICTNVLFEHVGRLFITIGCVMLNMKKTGVLKGGMYNLYKEHSEYEKSFYPVICCPSAVKVSDKLYHKVSKNNCCPKIISERYKK